MNVLEIITKRRDREENSYEELGFLANGAADGSIPDYQLSAWLMAAYLNPLSEQETAWLTKAMAESGERINLAGLPKPWVDKHSTGGVGDKTTLVLLPILAACGLTVVKMSGRGLGITGGTVDKLASIPGFRLDLTPNEMKAQSARIGLALTGQSPNLAPADKTFYALRDVTATIGSIPLIVSSILCKKIAGGADTIVLDVKCGSGAFMSTLEQARELARQLVRTGELLGLAVCASISDMGQPLGAMVGNALEVCEAMAVLRGDDLSSPSRRFQELCIYYGGETLAACGKTSDLELGQAQAREVLESGAAFAKFKEWIKAQGGANIWDVDSLPRAPYQETISNGGQAGWLASIDAYAIGQAVVSLGGGRKQKNDVVDPSVGIELHVTVGDESSQGQEFATIHARSEEQASIVRESVKQAFGMSPNPVSPPALIL